MTADAAVAQTAIFVFLVGFIIALIGFVATDAGDKASSVRVVRIFGWVGIGLILAAFAMWITSIWMQVR